MELLKSHTRGEITRLEKKEYDLKKLTVPERQRRVFTDIINLTEWAESLPTLNHVSK